MKILILNGPNLNLQGQRQPDVYGAGTFDDLLRRLRERYPHVEFGCMQSNVEGVLIDALHEAQGRYDGVVLISSILAREEFRRVSLLAGVVKGSIMGFGLDSYRLGVEALLE